MNYVGIDLHKKSISICVVGQGRNVLNRRRFYCRQEESIRKFFEALGAFQAVVEATASYPWLIEWFCSSQEASDHRRELPQREGRQVD